MRVKVLKTCFVDGAIRPAGTSFDWTGEPPAMGVYLSAEKPAFTAPRGARKARGQDSADIPTDATGEAAADLV